MGAPAAVLEALERDFEQAIEDLSALVRIPGVSADGFDPAALERSAEAVAALLSGVGLEAVEILRVDGAHPYVIGEWLAAGPDAPTALIYAHHDVQPPGRPDHWKTPPFEPTRGTDGRLYGRGVVDDKAGIVLHAAALRAWLSATARLPVNVKIVVEGEEEIGSGHLADFLRAHRDRLAADVLVLSDTANLATGLPSLTTSLRGIVNVDVRVRALDHPLHSGMWGGPVPDAASALIKLLARLVGDNGEISVPEITAGAPKLDDEERAALADLPFDPVGFRRGAGILEGTVLGAKSAADAYEQLWFRPALALLALDGMPLAEAANQLMAEARARVGVRVAPGQDPQQVCDALVACLHRDPPCGVRVETRVQALVPGWKTRPAGPAFDAARRALAAGFGREAVAIGCGATIPFVGPFAEVLGGVPALLLGLEDPPCNAHGENESLHLGDFQKAARASAHLLDELSRVPRVRGVEGA
ncbi:MAG: M20/M25/M40 family metallo-hydrolase [Myxococcales bacterium]|nr:M20/M25/M40 family metallo-hydrolase [Myxococcales bacterium]